MTGMRSKINDCFEFPEQIDMAPYHVDSLKDSELLTSPDWFQLVGVLVHSGTAESGHYYSYIKERPTNPATGRTWVEFNDTDVTPFDPALIPDQCFGGLTDPQPYSSRYLKSWNAYMLFYERIDPKATELESQLALSSSVPAKSEIPAEIAKHVAFDNAHWLRIYCMFDPSHAVFARELLEKLRDVNNGTCTQDHRTEAEAICLSLDHLDRVLSRSKDSSEFGKMLASLTKVIGTCATCCKLALEWVVDHESALRNLLLRCPSAKVRKDFAAMVLEALQHLRKNQPQWYGFDEVDDIDRPQSDTELRPEKLFSRLVSRLKDLWNFLPNHIKAWDDYFGLLADMANFGFHEAHVLLNHGYLIGCLEFLVVENPKASQLRNSYPHYASYCRLLEKGRRFSMDKLIELFANLFAKIDLHEETVRRLKDRRLDHDGMRLTESELNFIQFGGDISRSKNHCVFLEKILGTGINPAATKMIIQAMVLAEPELNMLELVHKTIKNGINVDPASLAAPYLRAAICFCECTPSPATAQHLIAFIAGEVDTIGISGGREHLDFFAQARRIRSLRPGIPPNFFNNCVLRAVPQWAPPLVVYWDEPIRKGTIDLLKTLIFGYDIKAMDDEEHAELIETAGRDLQVACARRCQGIVQQQKTIDSKSVEQVVAVIKHCISAYYDPEDDPRPVTEAESRFHR